MDGPVVQQPIALAPYQVEIVTAPWYDQTGHAITDTFLKCRRVGGSEAGAIRALMWLLGRETVVQLDGIPTGAFFDRKPMGGIVVSKDYASAKEFVKTVARNVLEQASAGDLACQAAMPHIFETKIFFPTTGTRIEAVASSGSSIRGKTGFLILDEFAFIRKQEEVYAAAKIVGDPTYGCPQGFPRLIITTPWEAGSFAHRIFTDPTFPFRRHSIDIWEAVRQGFPIDPEVAFRELGVPELIDTEYLCKWSRGGDAFFSPDKLADCQVDDDEAGKNRAEDDTPSGLPLACNLAACRIGIDCGGGVGRDFTAAVMWRFLQGKWWMTGLKSSNVTATVEMADRIADWVLDRDIVDPTVSVEIRCDRGVMGADFITQLVKRLQDRKRTHVIGVGMSTAEQQSYALAGRRLLDRGQMALYLGQDAGGEPNGCRTLCLELSRIKARRGQGGQVTFTTPRDPAKGHCDRAWAALIGLEGADGHDVRQLASQHLRQLYYLGDGRWEGLGDRGF